MILNFKYLESINVVMGGHKNLIPIIHHADENKFDLNHRNQHHSQNPLNHVSNKFKVINTIYGLFCCLIGVVLITTEPFKACGLCGGPIKIAMESFLIYMYYVSITWLLSMFVSISIAKRSNKISIKNHNGITRRLSNFIKSKENLFSTKLFEAHGLLDKSNDKTAAVANSVSEPKIGLSFDHFVQDDAEESNPDLNKFKYTYDYDNGTGELYVRVGTGVLSLCSMIDIGLNLVKLTESYRNGSNFVTQCKLTFIISILAEVGAFVFTFIQCFFIFKHANIVINQGKNIASIGLCHLVCTNFCVTLRSIVHETVHEIFIHRKNRPSDQFNFHIDSLNYSTKTFDLNKLSYHNKIAKVSPMVCWDAKQSESNKTGGIQATQDKIAPYLFACIIEYSLLCLTVFYIIWENIDKHNILNAKKDLNDSRKMSEQQNIEHNNLIFTKTVNRKIENRRPSLSERLHVNNFTIDCGKSASGLFFGLFVLLLTIISLIVYFIYKHEHEYLAVQISEITELVLISFSTAVVIAAFLKLKRFGYNNEHININYNHTLVIIALAGIYLFSFFSLVAIVAKGIYSLSEALTLIIHILCLIEGTLQAAFILDSLRRCAKDLKSKKEKPARSLIALLIMIDLSLWLSETFSVKKYEMNTTQLDYYDIVFWSIASSIASPLAIFYRFHSSVCLSDIWKTLYQ